jgi:hypothetical protein
MEWQPKLCPVCFRVHRDGQPKCIAGIPPPAQATGEAEG